MQLLLVFYLFDIQPVCSSFKLLICYRVAILGDANGVNADKQNAV